jgi:hypothetical protein
VYPRRVIGAGVLEESRLHNERKNTMARPKGSKNRKTIQKIAKKESGLNPRSELEAIYRSLKPLPKNTDRRIEILKMLMQ